MKRRSLTTVLVALALLGQAPPDATPDALKSLASAAARKAIDPLLKSPAGAKYAATEVAKAGPSPVLVQGRYVVTLTVDAPNAFGVLIRSNAVTVFKDDAGGWVMLSLVWTDSEDKPRVLYLAPAAERVRPEVARYIRDDWKRRQAAMEKLFSGKSVGVVPRQSPKGKGKGRKEAEVKLAVNTAMAHYEEKFGLGAEDCAQILGITP